jgi:hypothetical protein
MINLLTSAILCTILILATVFQIIRKQSKKLPGELLRVSETSVTAIMGFLLIAMGYLILIMKFIYPEMAGKDQTTYLYMGGFAVVCAVVGCGIMFYTYLRTVLVYEHGIVFVTLFGKNKKLNWKDITEIKVPPLTNKATLIGNNLSITVGGEPKAYKAFLKVAKKYVKPEIGSDILENLINRSIF